MFEHFTFGAMPQTRFIDESFPSPTDTSFPSSRAPTSIAVDHDSNQSDLDDIIARLHQQSLQQRSRDELAKLFKTWHMDNEPMTLEVDEEETLSGAEQYLAVSVPLYTSTSCRRIQRQLNVQLQSCDTHMKDINALVEDMISTNSQCRITSRPRVYTPPSVSRANLEVDPMERFDGSAADDIDEGFCEGDVDPEEELETSLRMVRAPTGITKHNDRYGSRDVISVDGRIKVRSVPRMRKRKVHVARGV